MVGEEPRPEERNLPRIGSYDLIEPLGTGGMSSVFRARHVENGLEVAIKVLPRTLAKNPTVLQRFLREAKSAEALEHPNIVAIYDRGLDHGRHYLVLEYVSGGDLHDRVRAGGPMGVDQAVDIVRSVAEALRYAAGRGLIHRDIKPANVLVDPGGTVKLADLGLALQAEAEDERVTREGTTVGTVDYMAPEQARDSRATSIRSDIYSLGCMFYFLLSGQPPFPGGDVAEKLNRHINAPPPDIRQLRPDVPEALSTVIRKMLAKKPEQRFGNYDELIAAIAREKGAPAAAEPLTALFDDEENDLVPADDGFVPLAPAPPPSARPTPMAEPSSIPMADLALLDAASEPRSLPAPNRKPSAALNRPSRPAEPPPAPDLVALDDDDDDEPDDSGYIPVAGQRNRPAAVPWASTRRGMSEAERSWLMKCILLGLGLILLVIAVDQVIRASKTESPSELAEVAPTPDAASEEAAGSPVPGVAAAPKADTPPLALVAPAVKKAEPKVERSPLAAFVEPADTPPELLPEPNYGAGVEEKFLPDWARIPANRPGEKVVVVRRIPDAHDADTRSTIRSALDVAGVSTVEVADNGPFYETDLRLPGEGRVIRARAGYRPIIALSQSRTGPLQTATTWLDLAEKSLTLEGLDLVVDVNDVPPNLSTLFALHGGSLVLRDCTLTVVNRAAPSRGFTLVKSTPSAGGKPSRLLLERTFVRGAFTTVVDVAGGPAEVVGLRSVVVNGQGTFASTSSPTPAAGVARRFAVVRSIVSTQGPALELNDAIGGGKPQPITLRALGTTFAHSQSPQGVSLVVARGDAAGPTAMVDWLGGANTYAGWTGLLVSGPSRTVRVANVAAARTIWPGTDATSTEETRSWPQNASTCDRTDLAQLRELAPSRLAVLSRTASPNATVLEKTADEFAQPRGPALASVPNLPGRNRPPGQAAPPGTPSAAGPRATRGAPTGILNDRPSLPPVPSFIGGMGAAMGASAPTVLGTATAIPGTRELTFDTEAAPLNGDLGLFLAENAKEGDPLVKVRVRGMGQHTWSPCRLPDGVSLEVVVEPDAGGRTPSWIARATSSEALIDIRGGSVLLSNVQLARNGSATLKQLVRVENGHLALHRCRLSAPGTVETGGGGLLGFRAAGTGPLPRRPGGSLWPFETPVDRPTCRVIETVLSTGGCPLTAELGRGRVALTQCAVISGSSAFALQPARVARRRFEADLGLDRCTVACDQTFVEFGRWRGSEPGPDRPWLVSTVDSAFFGNYERTDSASVLLRADSEALAHGAIFWQSRGDAFEVSSFLVTGDGPPPAGRKPDIRTQWTSFWGERHARNLTGPRQPGGQPSHRTMGRLRPHEVEPGDLAIDPEFPPGRRPSMIGVDLSRLGITPASRGARKR